MFDNATAHESDFPFIQDLKKRSWDGLSETQAFGVYALGLHCAETDFLSLAADANTDGTDDKKIDLLHIDRDTNSVYIGQACVYETWNKEAAESNKAADLASGMGWLLNDKLETLPQRLQPKAQELRELIESGEQVRIDLLFIHNANESMNVESELRSVANTTKRIVDKESVNVSFRELGIKRIQDSFDDLDKDLLITSVVSLPIQDNYRLNNGGWDAIVFALAGNALKQLYADYGERLFSANIRGYLSVVNKKGNINKVIRETASESPDNFWPYNNGITILTNRFTIEDDQIHLEGLSIINGAQTTGVIGELDATIANGIHVPCRVVACTDDDIVDNIIRYNTHRTLSSRLIYEAMTLLSINFAIRLKAMK